MFSAVKDEHTTQNINIFLLQSRHPCVGVGAGKILGVRRTFAQISPKRYCDICLQIFSHKHLFLVWPQKNVLIVFCKHWAPFL